MKLDDILQLMELFAKNWKFGLATIFLLASGVYAFSFVAALGKAHGTQLGDRASGRSDASKQSRAQEQQLRSEPEVRHLTPSDTFAAKAKRASSQANLTLNKYSGWIGVVGVILSALGIYGASQQNPCLKPGSQMTIQEKIECDPNW